MKPSIHNIAAVGVYQGHAPGGRLNDQKILFYSGSSFTVWEEIAVPCLYDLVNSPTLIVVSL
jgi:hypothetical protein